MVKAVDRMSITLNEGEIRGLVGESGSGKNLVATAIVGVCKSWKICWPYATGERWPASTDAKNADDVIARDIAIFQEPSRRVTFWKVGNQLIEAILHTPLKIDGGNDLSGARSSYCPLTKVGVRSLA